jgi:nicotinamidase-related amidase
LYAKRTRSLVVDDAARDLYARRGLGGRQASALRPALLVIDLNNAFTDPDSPLACDTDAAVEAVATLLEAARAQGVPRVFTTIEYDAEGMERAAAFLEKMPSLAIMEPGTRWSRIDERIAPQAGEPVLRKLFASGFWGTELDAILKAEGCDGVIVTGASTSGCVRATVVDALQHGYRATVPREAVADRAAAPHDAALFDIQAKYGEVVATEDALGLIRGAAHGATA